MKEFKQGCIEELKPEMLAVLVFSAAWCGACKLMHKTMDQVIEIYKGRNIEFFEVDPDLEVNGQAVSDYQVSKIPTIIFIKNNKMESKLVGASALKTYTEIIDKFISK